MVVCGVYHLQLLIQLSRKQHFPSVFEVEFMLTNTKKSYPRRLYHIHATITICLMILKLKHYHIPHVFELLAFLPNVL